MALEDLNYITSTTSADEKLSYIQPHSSDTTPSKEMGVTGKVIEAAAKVATQPLDYLDAQAQAVHLGTLDFTGSVEKAINKIKQYVGYASKEATIKANEQVNAYYKAKVDKYEYNKEKFGDYLGTGLGVGRFVGNLAITAPVNPAFKAAGLLPGIVES